MVVSYWSIYNRCWQYLQSALAYSAGRTNFSLMSLCVSYEVINNMCYH